MILTHTREEVELLNQKARLRLWIAQELGTDVTIETERGERRFASGDRVMFLKNERELGVKNGSLGTVESVSRVRMAVMLDDGRSVAFYLKNYNQLDHGYAATIHKSQGVTVDRVHVLATPGLDRHAAYVALSRHRERVDLHYGRDDFADRDRLIRTLSRERQKDMVSDYAREFAGRRQIVAPAVAAPAQERKRNMFDGLRLRVPVELSAPAPSPPARAPSLHDAVVRFATAAKTLIGAGTLGLDPLPHDQEEWKAARRALDAVRPDGGIDMRDAFNRDRQLVDEAAAGKTQNAIRAMEWESRYRSDPEFRAEHFIKVWRHLGDHHEQLERRGDEAGARKQAGHMAAFAKTLERDPQVESLLRKRTKDLGIPPFQERPLSQALPDWIGWGRGRGLER